MDTVVTTVDPTAGDLKISWTEPDDQGDTITSYLIQILDKNTGTYSQDAVNCPTTTASPLYCLIPMLTLPTNFGY